MTKAVCTAGSDVEAARAFGLPLNERNEVSLSGHEPEWSELQTRLCGLDPCWTSTHASSGKKVKYFPATPNTLTAKITSLNQPMPNSQVPTFNSRFLTLPRTQSMAKKMDELPCDVEVARLFGLPLNEKGEVSFSTHNKNTSGWSQLKIEELDGDFPGWASTHASSGKKVEYLRSRSKNTLAGTEDTFTAEISDLNTRHGKILALKRTSTTAEKMNELGD